MLHTVIFTGRSGCGKGTQADLFKNRIARLDPDQRQILYVETGERFRQFIRGEHFSARISREAYERDDRQPDFLACLMWADVLIKELGESMHLIIDGAPRSLPEALVLSSAMKFYKRERPVVIHLEVSRKWSEDRLLARGRLDDRLLSKINKRLDWFETDTLPALEYLKNDKLYRFVEVNGEQAIAKVHSDIIAVYDYAP